MIQVTVRVSDRIYVSNLSRELCQKLIAASVVYLPPPGEKKLSKDMLQNVKVLTAEYLESCLALPRGFPCARYKELVSASYIDQRSGYPCFFPESRYEPKPEQLTSIAQIIQSKDTKAGVTLVQQQTSAGKTFMSLYAASKLGHRTLIVVDTNFIREGWVKDIGKFFGIPPEEVGIIQGNEYRIGECFTVALVQTLQRRDYSDIFRQFGTAIFDEAQSYASIERLELLNSCCCRYKIGLTATLARKDMRQLLLLLQFGQSRAAIEAAEVSTSTSLLIDDVRILKTLFDYPGDPKLDNNDYINTLCEDKARNELIADVAALEIKRGKRVLIVTARVEHAKVLHHLIIKKMMPRVGLCVIRTSGFGIKPLEVMNRFQTGQARCLVATVQCVFKGASIPQMDRLIITFPIADPQRMIQLLGRIRRACTKEEHNYVKEDVVVYDIIDTMVPYSSQNFWNNHAEAYKKTKTKGWSERKVE